MHPSTPSPEHPSAEPMSPEPRAVVAPGRAPHRGRRAVAVTAAVALAAAGLVGAGAVPASRANAASDRGASSRAASDSGASSRAASDSGASSRAASDSAPQARAATFNVSMFRNHAGELAQDLADAHDQTSDLEVRNVAEIIQRQHPDVLLLNEFDYDAKGIALAEFQRNFLGVPQHAGVAPVHYGYAMAFPSNTGIPSGFDLDRSGTVGGGNDALGFGQFPGQYAFVILSRFPIATAGIRTFQDFLWKDMPGARLPDDPATPAPHDWYTPAELNVFRLSSKNHVDVPIRIAGRTVHVLASHPTPPTFDGPEDRNGTRNADEIRFWSDYVTPERGGYIHDDAGHRGGLRPGSDFVVMGDLNADPAGDGNGIWGAADQIVQNRLLTNPNPTSPGAAEQARLQGGANIGQRGPAARDTADFADGPNGPGNLRADEVLPSVGLRIRDAGVFWPASTDPLFRLVGTYNPKYTNGFPSSDHRMVWVDLSFANQH